MYIFGFAALFMVNELKKISFKNNNKKISQALKVSIS